MFLVGMQMVYKKKAAKTNPGTSMECATQEVHQGGTFGWLLSSRSQWDSLEGKMDSEYEVPINTSQMDIFKSERSTETFWVRKWLSEL